jgi:hypothetical protein
LAEPLRPSAASTYTQAFSTIRSARWPDGWDRLEGLTF